MSIAGIFSAAAVVGVVGIFVGLFLGVAGIRFHVEKDEKEEAILAALPGNNCGGCGYAGCSGLAAAIAKGEAPVNACPVGGEPVGSKIAAIMGVEAGASQRKVAFVACMGDCDKANRDYEYSGYQDCRMMGFVVDREKCKACGKCVEVCPKHLISLIPYQAEYAVACSSADKGPVTMKACQSGCIGCGLCMRNCPAHAVNVKDFHAVIDQEKCTGCGTCAEKCPKKCIVKM